MHPRRYATSVGSKALTIKQACFLATIFEFLGAFAAGNAVADTIRKGIAHTNCFEESYMDSALLMYGNLCVVAMVGFWLLLASWAEMPVSTTHSAVGGMVGMTIAIKGSMCVVWFKEEDAKKLHIPGGVVGIALSWIFSPVLSGIFAVMLYGFVRNFIMKSKDSFNRAILFYPLLVFIAVWINSFFIISKGISKAICKKGNDESVLCHGNGKVKGWTALGVCCGIGAGVTLLCFPLFKMIKTRVQQMVDEGTLDKRIEDATKRDEDYKPPTTKMGKMMSVFGKDNLNQNVHDIVGAGTDTSVNAVHDNAQKFDPATEAVFRYIQIFTAILDSFAHGANDVANAMGPFMAIFAIYNDGGSDRGISKKADTGDDGRWILALGGIGIGLGLIMYGHKIMRAIGVKLAVITPSRGFAIELGAAIVIIIGSYLGLPLSTTHCQVGATTGVALFEGKKGVNWKVFGKCCIGWVITLIVAGTMAGLLTAQGIYAPLASGNCHRGEGKCGLLPTPGSPQAMFLQMTCPYYMEDQAVSPRSGLTPQIGKAFMSEGLPYLHAVGDWKTDVGATQDSGVKYRSEGRNYGASYYKGIPVSVELDPTFFKDGGFPSPPPHPAQPPPPSSPPPSSPPPSSP